MADVKKRIGCGVGCKTREETVETVLNCSPGPDCTETFSGESQTAVAVEKERASPSRSLPRVGRDSLNELGHQGGSAGGRGLLAPMLRTCCISGTDVWVFVGLSPDQRSTRN